MRSSLQGSSELLLSGLAVDVWRPSGTPAVRIKYSMRFMDLPTPLRRSLRRQHTARLDPYDSEKLVSTRACAGAARALRRSK